MWPTTTQKRSLISKRFLEASNRAARSFTKPHNVTGTYVTVINPVSGSTWFAGYGADAPTVVYIHGGYWQTLSKEDFAFVAKGPLELGYNVVLAEYTLAPQSSMTQIVQEIGRLLDHLSANRDELKIGRGPVCLVGHSAGGHLSLVHRSHPLLAHTMAISPLVDLEPISCPG